MPTILITGAGRGIGLALARHYATNGWSVVTTCRDPGRAAALRALAAGHDVDIHQLEMTDHQAIDALAATLAERRLDVLFNNAGVFGDFDRQTLDDLDFAGWPEVFAINLIAPVKMVQAFLPQIEASERRQVAMMSSQMGSISGASGGAYIYRTSKAALNMATKLLAGDLAARGITLVALHPGWVRTDMGGPNADVGPEESAAGLARVLDRMRPGKSGSFRRYDGRKIQW